MNTEKNNLMKSTYTMDIDVKYAIELLSTHLYINAVKKCQPIISIGENPMEDKQCHKALLMVAHLKEIEDYLKNNNKP